jgi:hypothetical protein
MPLLCEESTYVRDKSEAITNGRGRLSGIVSRPRKKCHLVLMLFHPTSLWMSREC